MDGIFAVVRCSQREIEKGASGGETLLAGELERINKPAPSLTEEAEAAYFKMIAWIEDWNGAFPLSHVRITPRFTRGAGLGATRAKCDRDRRTEILVNPECWETILHLDGIDKLDASGEFATLAGLPMTGGYDPLLAEVEALR